MKIIPQFQWAGHRDAVYALGKGANKSVISAGGDGTVVAWNPSHPHLPGRAIFRLKGGIYSLQTPSPVYNAWVLGGMKGDMHFFQELNVVATQGHSTQQLADNHKVPSTNRSPNAHPAVPPNPYVESDPAMVFSGKPPTSNGVATGRAPIHDLQFMHNRLWSAHGDGRLLCWRLEDPHPTIDSAYSISPSAIRCLATHPSDNCLASGSSDGKVRLTTDAGKVVQEFDGHTLSVFSLLFLAGGKYLLSGSRDAHLAVWDTNSGQLLDRFPAHLGTLNQLISIPEYGWVGSAGRDKEIRLWDAKTLELRKVINRNHAPDYAHTHSVNRLLWIPEHDMLMSAGDDRKIRAWHISDTT